MKFLSILFFLISGVIFGQCVGSAIISQKNYSQSLTQTNTYITITSSVNPLATVKLDAHPTNGYVLMNPGFIAAPTGNNAFIAQSLDGCGVLIPKKLIDSNPLSNSIQELKIFPNPVNNILNINFNQTNKKPFEFSLYDATGKLIKTEYFSNASATYQVDVSSLIKNNYIYKISTDDYLKTGIILKE
jgi:hypothetical protein